MKVATIKALVTPFTSTNSILSVNTPGSGPPFGEAMVSTKESFIKNDHFPIGFILKKRKKSNPFLLSSSKRPKQNDDVFLSKEYILMFVVELNYSIVEATLFFKEHNMNKMNDIVLK